MSGWIKLHRKLTEWEWYSDVNTSRVFLHLLLVANHKDNQWRGIPIKRGQRLTSLSKLADETSLSVKNIRTAIKRLKSTSELASHSTAQHTVFTIINYDLYQSEASETANDGQAKGKQVATNKNVKNDNNDKNSLFDRFWDLYAKKVDTKKCKAKFDKLSQSKIDKIFEVLPAYIASTPDKQFRKLPMTWLNGECWNDEIIIHETEVVTDLNFDQLVCDFNESFNHKEKVPVAVKITDNQKKQVAKISSEYKMGNSSFKSYFDFCANDERFDYVTSGVNMQAVGITYFLKEETILKAM